MQDWVTHNIADKGELGNRCHKPRWLLCRASPAGTRQLAEDEIEEACGSSPTEPVEKAMA